MTFKLTRGETFSLAVEAFEIVGDASLVGATCEADLVRTINGNAPSPDTPPVAVFAVSALLSDVVPGGGPGWVLTLTPAQTETLPAAPYAERITVTLANGFVEKLDVFGVEVRNG